MSQSTDPTLARKSDHIRLALSEDSQIKARGHGFDAWELEHQALPELDLDEIDTSLTVLGKSLAAPVMIASMTGGPELGSRINHNLAAAAQELGLAMGLGSLRVIFESPDSLSSFQVRDVAPDILLLANLGAVQLNYGFTEWHCRQAVERVGADALYLHLNPLQEAIQPEGDTNFKDLTEHIAEICSQLSFPILAKECGNGLSARVARELVAAGVQGLEVSGRGGTSWAWIEAQRNSDPLRQRLGETFANWGIPTPESIRLCRMAAPDTLIIGSGGIRNGLDAAKAIALGADTVSIAQPLLQAAQESPQAVVKELELFMLELRIAMFCCGARNLTELRRVEVFRV